MSLPSDAKIFVAEHRGFVGQSIVRKLQRLGYHNITTREARELDLREKDQVHAFFEKELPDYVFVSSVKVEGPVRDAIYPAQWLHDNLLVMANTIHAAYLYDVEKLVCIDCSSTYADLGALPRTMSYLQAELIEETQRVCTVVSQTTTELCDSYRRQYGCDFVSAVFSSLYGPPLGGSGQRSSVVLALLHDMQRAKETGQAAVRWPSDDRWCRDLLYADDMADACLFLAGQVSEAGAIHVGGGHTWSLVDLAEAVKAVMGYEGRFEIDPGAARLPPRGAFAGDMLHARGWSATTPLHVGIRQTYRWYLQHRPSAPLG